MRGRRKLIINSEDLLPKSFDDIDLISFDIFDTLITRRVSSPDGIFRLMQYHLNRYKRDDIPDIFRNDFCNIRKDGEAAARLTSSVRNAVCNNKSKKGYAEISFDDIYLCIGTNYGLNEDAILFLKKLEITIELTNIVVIKKNLDLLKSLLTKGKRVILISDMYYPEQTVRQILISQDDIFKTIPIYISCDYGVSKCRGGLYRIVQEIENIDVNKWCHCGDDYTFDISDSPTRKVVYFNSCNLLPYEKKLIYSHPSVFSSFTVGASKLARSTYNEHEYKEVYDFGSSFVAPILYNYVQYVLQQSQLHGFNKLYFIARDGNILKLIADEIISVKKLDIKTKYIYGSRLVWRVPVEKNYDGLIQWFFHDYRSELSPDFLAYRLNIDSEECRQMMEVRSIYTKLNESDRCRIRDKFLQDYSIRNRIIDLNREKANLTRDYLKQELDLNQKDIVFIDSTGTGVTLDSLVGLLGDSLSGNLKIFYIIKYNMNEEGAPIKYSYGVAPKSINYWLEVVLSTLEGTTLAYKKEGDKIVAVKQESGVGVYLKQWGYDIYLKSILDYTTIQANTEIINNINVNTHSTYDVYADHLLYKIDKTTADVFGSIPYDLIRDTGKCVGCAPKLNIFKLIRNFILGRPYDEYLKFMTIVQTRSSLIACKVFKLVVKYKSLQKFLFTINRDESGEVVSIRILGIKIIH